MYFDICSDIDDTVSFYTEIKLYLEQFLNF